jgi:hypothetical protein
MYFALPLLVLILGLLMWIFVDGAKYPKALEIGKIMFAAGLLALLLTWHPGGGKPLSLTG